MTLFSRRSHACRAAFRLVSRLLDGESLMPDEEKQVTTHLGKCAPCQQRYETLKTQSDLLRATASVPVPAAARGIIAARALSVWVEQEKTSTVSPIWRQKQRVLALAASVALAGTGIGMRLARNEPVKATAIPPAFKKEGALSAGNPFETFTSRVVGIRQAAVARKENRFTLPVCAATSPINESNFGRIASPKNAVRPAVIPPAFAPTTTPGDDLAYLNRTAAESAAYAGRWLSLTPDETQRLQAEVEQTIQSGDRFVEVPFPRVASLGGRDVVSASAIAAYRQEREIVDARLQRKVSLGKKRVSFADLCADLEKETGIGFAAHKNVADDKITIFCTDRPLRDVMREIATLFNFSWQRTGEEGAYQYRLTQPLRSQLIEEELRNHDRNEALVALDKEMEKYKSLAGLSPQEAKERAANTAGDEKKIYQTLAGAGWGPAQLYAGLSSDQLAALRDGQALSFAAAPGSGDTALPPNVAAGILDSLGDSTRVFNGPNGPSMNMGGDAIRSPGGIPPANVPNVNASARLELVANELGQFTLLGASGFSLLLGNNAISGMSAKDMAVGRSPSSQEPKNAEANAALKSNPELQTALRLPAREKTATPQVTTADVLEAFHKATGRDVIGDYYTRLFDGELLTAASPRPLFTLLCDVSDKARLRWGTEENWLSFRSAGFFNDRPKEVPNRLLERWSGARQANQKVFPVELLLEIAQLNDSQLNASSMAEGAKILYGLQEWDTARNKTLRESWRLLASLPKNLQKTALKGVPIRFEQLLPAQQERFAALVLGKNDLASAALARVSSEPTPAEKLAGAKMEAEYHAPDAAHADALIRFTYQYGTENAPSTKILTPNRTTVSTGSPSPKSN